MIEALGATLAPLRESEKPQLSPRLDADFIKNIQRISRLLANSTPSNGRGCRAFAWVMLLRLGLLLQGFLRQSGAAQTAGIVDENEIRWS